MIKLLKFIQKLLLLVGILSIFSALIILNKFTIIKYLNKFTMGSNTEILNNKYTKNTTYNYVNNTSNLIPKNKQIYLTYIIHL